MSRDDAAATLLAYSIAGLIFVGSTAALLLATANLTARPYPGADPGQQVLAEGLVGTLARGVGTTKTGTVDGWSASCGTVLLATCWDRTGGAGPGRPGLLESPGVLDTDKVLDVVRAPKAAGMADQLLAYDEALEAFGLNDLAGGATFTQDLDLGFHVRGTPVLYEPVGQVPIGNVVYIASGARAPAVVLCLSSPAEFTQLSAVASGAVCYGDDAGITCDATPLVVAITLLLTNPGLMVIGSGVDHTCLNNGGFTATAQDWITNGGDILVMGSDSAVVANWQNTLFGMSVTPATDTLRAVDPFHPLLQVPNVLSPSSYHIDVMDSVFDRGSAAGVFRILVRDDLGTTDPSDDEPVLQFTPPGALGPGRFILANLRAANLTGPCGDVANPFTVADVEAECLFQNVVVSHYQQLFLDYGAQMPTGAAAIPASAFVRIDDPTAGNLLAPTGLSEIPIELTAYVFREVRD